MSVPRQLAARVRRRAQGRCEYCQMSQALQGATFHVEHIIPHSAGGVTTDDNLAIACPGCNLHKADRRTARDPATGSEVSLFHPRRDRWKEHFAWSGVRLVGITAQGRATVAALELNHSRRLGIRRAEAEFGLFPPPK
ncbi:MAG: HNH endonuclease [Verrucomicrobiae bacterium]|nr:HNH endonuclease [Verrucomicrobiae bacterium]